jgi:hypothetical protein
MTLTVAMLKDMFAAGCTPDQVIMVAEKEEARDAAAKERKREQARIRKQRERAKTAEMSRVTCVTERDMRDTPLSPLSDKEIPPAPPKEINSSPLTPQTTLLSASARDGLDNLQARLLEAVGEEKIQGYAAIVTGPIIELISAGVDLELDILPALKVASLRLKRPAGSWNYFVPGIREAYERRIAAAANLPKPVDEFKNGMMMRVDGKFVPTTERRWSQRIDSWQKTGKWETAQWGPAPGCDGCTAPKHLLHEARVAA